MLILGDVLAVVASLFGICISAWGTLVAFSLLFPNRAERAADCIRVSPGKMGVRGLVVAVVMLLSSLVLLQSPAPIVKLVGWIILLALLSIAALGTTGLCLVVASRVSDREPNLSAYAALMRGAALVVIPGLLPIFGWFLVAPAMLAVGIGAGTKALRP